MSVRLIVEGPVRMIETNVHCASWLLQVKVRKERKVFVALTLYGRGADAPFREEGDLVMGATTRGCRSRA